MLWSTHRWRCSLSTSTATASQAPRAGAMRQSAFVPWRITICRSSLRWASACRINGDNAASERTAGARSQALNNSHKAVKMLAAAHSTALAELGPDNPTTLDIGGHFKRKQVLLQRSGVKPRPPPVRQPHTPIPVSGREVKCC